MRHLGKLTSWKDDKGYGFITPARGKKEVFVHISAFNNKSRRPVGCELLSYELRTDSSGKLQAVNVVFSNDPIQSVSQSGVHPFSIIFVLLFLILVVIFVILGKLPVGILGVYSVASIITFVMYATDKSAAKSNAWRTKESTLHFISLVGGWPGALIAQQQLRHKSKKQSFQIVFWLTVIINCVVVAGLILSSVGFKLS